MTDFSSLSASRIAHIAQSKDIDQAAQMGFIDRIIDFFKGGVKREAIQNIFNSITQMQLGVDRHQNRELKDYFSGPSLLGLNESERLDQLTQLRSLALPEQRHQFQFDIRENPNGTFGTSIKIAGVEVYQNNDIYESSGSGQIPKLFIAKFQMNLEDAVQTKDTHALLNTLNEMETFIAKQMPTHNTKREPLSVEERQDFVYAKLSEMLTSMPTDAKTMLLTEGVSDFGNRLRGVLNFGYDALEQASSGRAPVDVPQSAIANLSVPEMLIMNAEHDSTLLAKPLSLQARFAEVLSVCAKDLNTELTLDPPIKIDTHSELTEAETRTLNAIGIPDSLLRIH